MRIGEVAAQAGVNVETLRYYERRGLLGTPLRRPSGYRDYTPETIAVIRFVKRAQELGFTLDEVDDLLRLRRDKEGRCADVRAAATAKMLDIDSRLRHLRAMKHALEVLVRSCARDGAARACPILEALDDTRESAGRRASARRLARSAREGP
jgi:Hg(II)-responsive transcriptional regulator